MNPRKGLMGLFGTVFLLSAIVMVMLLVDDRNDLSSRASGWLANSKQAALPGIALAPNEKAWDGKAYKIPVVIKYDEKVWMSPKDRNIVFYHRDHPITIRVLTEEIDKDALKDILGPDFILSKQSSKTPDDRSGWMTQIYNYTFYGAPKVVEVWSGPSGVSLVAVRPAEILNSDIEIFVDSIISDPSPGLVQGAATQDETVRIAALVRPSVVMILNNYCSKIKFDIPNFVLADREYPFCIASVGSGFFINDQGYIATNGHVVKNSPDPSLFYAVASGSLDSLLADYLQVYTAEQTGSLPTHDEMALKVKEAHAAKENIYQLAALVDDLYKRKFLAVGNSTNEYYVQLGNTPLQLTKDGVTTGDDILAAKLIDSDYSEPDKATGFSSSDVAVLKIEGSNYPALPLGNIDDLSVGSTLQIFGFPGIVTGSNSFLLDTSANAEPTFTKGVVSAFKLAKGDKKRMIQTDASINHGNSGGPGISSDGKVIGLATYGLTPEEGSGNYNFLRDVQDLKVLMQKNNIIENRGDTYSLWKNGLESYWLSYFKYAESDFQKVVSNYPHHPSVGKYLEAAKSKINTSEDQTPKFTRSSRTLYMTLSGGAMALSLIGFFTLWIMDQIDAKKQLSQINLPTPLEKQI